MATHSSTLAWKIPWIEVHNTVQEIGIKTIPMEKKCKKAKRLSGEALQISVKRSEKQRRKERYKHLNSEFQRIARRDKKAFLGNQCKEIEENNRMLKTRDLFKAALAKHSCCSLPWMRGISSHHPS